LDAAKLCGASRAPAVPFAGAVKNRGATKAPALFACTGSVKLWACLGLRFGYVGGSETSEPHGHG